MLARSKHHSSFCYETDAMGKYVVCTAKIFVFVCIFTCLLACFYVMTVFEVSGKVMQREITSLYCEGTLGDLQGVQE